MLKRLSILSLLIRFLSGTAFAPSTLKLRRSSTNVANRLEPLLNSNRRNLSKQHAPSIPRTALMMSFLPPAGGGSNKQGGLGEIAGGVLTLLAAVAFLASPLGAIVFAIFNSFLALLVLLPIAAVVGFNVWQYVATISGNCPNCGSPVRVMKDQSPSICFSCGSVLQAKDDQIFIANLNSNMDYSSEDRMRRTQGEPSMFRSWLDDIGGTQPRPVGKSTAKTTIIDVEVESDDRK
jgi:hypothetical protein